ncbi:MAG TPA: tryptophan--tRNA ligase, partial [Usitatibacter sp.]
REKGFEEKAEAAVKKMGPKKAKLYRTLRTRFQEQGDHEALTQAQELVNDVQNLSLGDKERLYGYIEGGGRVILAEPDALLTETPKILGLDGQKMSKSANNAIMLRETPESVTHKIRTMQTDPARVRRTDPGNPEKCPVWNLHLVYSDAPTKDWVWQGCTTAGIGCLECKQPVIEAINAELRPIRERAAQYEEDPMLVRNIIQDGCEKASDLANDTMRDVRDAMGLNYT